MKSKAELKYQQILYREFENTMDMFIYSNDFPTFEDDSKLGEFKNFVMDIGKINNIKLAYAIENQTYISVAELDKKYIGYNKLYYKTNNYFKYFKIQFDESIFPEKIFIEKYGNDDDERKCEYCGISEKNIACLINGNMIYTKALWNRGKFMEIDKKDPFLGYTANNTVLCCYWCNNAKTDEFNDFEFAEIQSGMKAIWNLRIDKFNKGKEKDKQIALIN